MYIPFRLRPSRDDDIKQWIAQELERAAADDRELDRSDIIRAALRYYFRNRKNHTCSPIGKPEQHHSPEPQSIPLRDIGKPFLNVSIKKNGEGPNPRRQ